MPNRSAALPAAPLRLPGLAQKVLVASSDGCWRGAGDGKPRLVEGAEVGEGNGGFVLCGRLWSDSGEACPPHQAQTQKTWVVGLVDTYIFLGFVLKLDKIFWLDWEKVIKKLIPSWVM